LAERGARGADALRQAAERSPATAAAAEIASRLGAPAAPESGSAYLAQHRELLRLHRALCAAEATLAADERAARAGLRAACALLAEVAPGLDFSQLVREVPLVPGMGERLGAIVALVRARMRLVPLLLPLRPTWKR